MFKRLQYTIFKYKRVLALSALFCLFAVKGQAFQLESDALTEQADYFSQLKVQDKYKPLKRLISNCKRRKSSRCISDAQMIYIDPEFIFFRNLVAELAVSYVTKGRRSLRLLGFLNKNELRRREIYRILNTAPVKEVETFFGADFFMVEPEVLDIFTSNVHLFCKYSTKKVFIDLALNSLIASDDLYERNLSKFPCKLNLKNRMGLLLSEIENSRKANAHEYDYYFKFLRKKVSRKVLRSFSRRRRKKMEQRKKEIWADLFKYKPYISQRIITHLFFKSDYEVLSHGASFEKNKLKSLSVGALQYVVKALVIEGKYKEALRISEGVKIKKTRAIEEIYLMRGNAYLRLGQYKKSEATYKILLENIVDMRLSALYWLRMSLKYQGKKSEVRKVDRQILESYPFSYYGLLVAKEQKGVDFFKVYQERVVVKESFAGSLTPGEIERLKFYYTYKLNTYFKRTFQGFEMRLNPKQRALFSLVFRNMGDQLEVIRSLNLIWDLDSDVRKEPFVTASFPRPFKEDLESAVQKTSFVSKAVAYAVMRQESAFGVSARSPSGARGLMQLLPSTAKDLSRKIRYRKYRKPRDLYKPRINIYLGTNYMNRLANASKGYLPYAFASYNAGPGRMYKWGVRRDEIVDLRQGIKKESVSPINELWIEELPWSETRFYTKALLRNMGIYLAVEGKQEDFNCSAYWVCSEKNL